MRDIEQTALKPEVMPGILKDNAAGLLGLRPSNPQEGDTQ
jgi:predicted TIM-barrel fold metal-dependent hydrolase